MRRESLLRIFALFLSGSQAALLYPESSLLQFTLGVSVPIVMRKSGNLVFSSGFQMNYALPWNETQLEPAVISARHVRDLNLRDIYAIIEEVFNENDWQDGRDCLLRSICELAEVPLERTEQDVVEEIMHLILTPSEDLAESPGSTHEIVDGPYREAEELGRNAGDCVSSYPNCAQSPLEFITDFIHP